MAKIAGYYEDNSDELYSEGPYVLTSGPCGQGFRIEKRWPKCPIMPPLWVYDLRRLWGIPEGWQPKHVLAPLVDALNWAHLLIAAITKTAGRS